MNNKNMKIDIILMIIKSFDMNIKITDTNWIKCSSLEIINVFFKQTFTS